MQFDFVTGELSSRNIGSLKTHEQAARLARKARRLELLSFLWLMFMLAIIPFAFGIVTGIHLAS